MKLDNSGTNVNNRINDSVTVSANGGGLILKGKSGDSTVENLGLLTVAANLSTSIELDQNGATSNRLVFNNSTIPVTGSLHLIGTNGDLSRDGANRVSFLNTPPVLTNGVLPNVTVTGSGGTDIATWSPNSDGAAIFALPARPISPTSPSRADEQCEAAFDRRSDGLHAHQCQDDQLVGHRQRRDVAGGAALTIGAAGGGVIFSGSGTSAVTVEYLTLPVSTFLYADAGNTATISSKITGATTQINKAGTGTVVLSAANEFAGQTNVNRGVLKVTNDFALGQSNNNTAGKARWSTAAARWKSPVV